MHYELRGKRYRHFLMVVLLAFLLEAGGSIEARSGTTRSG
jgi:hypothetical protein